MAIVRIVANSDSPYCFNMPLLALLLLMACRDLPPQGLDLDGKSVAPFESDATATVLVFVQTDCPVSNRYAPTLSRLHDRFAPQGAVFWHVYPNRGESPEAIRAHRRDYDLKGHVARDVHHILVERTSVGVTPEAVVFGRRGNIVYKGRIDNRYTAFDQVRPAATRHDLADAIEALLADRIPPTSDTRAIGCFISDLQ